MIIMGLMVIASAIIESPIGAKLENYLETKVCM